jgi:beta-lactamase class A
MFEAITRARRIVLVALSLAAGAAAAGAQTAQGWLGSPTPQTLPGTRLASPSTTSATFSAGMSKDGNRSYVGSAATTDTIAISAQIRPEAAHVGQPGQLYLVVMTAPGQFIMRNASGAFVPWNGEVGTLVPAAQVPALPGVQVLDIFSGVLGVPGEFQIFVGYAAADRVLHYSSAPLTVRLIIDSDKDGVADADDLHPLNPARTMAIAPVFPRSNGIFQFPDYPSTRQLKWVLEQLAPGATTPSAGDITARFTGSALAATPVAQVQSLLQTARTAHPGSIVIDPISVSPTLFRGLIGIAGNPGSGRYLSLGVKVASGLIDSFSLSNYPLNANMTTPENQTLTMTQAFDKLAALAAGTSLLVARIEDDRCVPVKAHEATTLRSTGSIFKTWVLGALGQALNEGVISPTARLPLVATEVVRNSVLGSEPLGTVLPLADMASAMMGISDNTATDHVHELVGRSRVEAIVRAFNHSAPERLTPFLSINEMFNLFSGVSAAQARAYRDGSEEFQRQFLDSVLAPLGPVTGSLDNYQDTFFSAAWMASPMDVCAAMAGLRQFNDRSPGLQMVDQAFSAEVVFPFVRNRWDRVWFKGGSLANTTGLKVLTYAWMLESDSRGAWVAVSMHNDLGYTQDLSKLGIDWTMARVLQLIADGTFN